MLISEQTVMNFLSCVTLENKTNEALIEEFNEYIKGDSGKKMNYIIIPYRCLPCSLEKFEINGICADVEDFGETITGGDCMNGTCHSVFSPKLPAYEILRKYGISLEDYSIICEELENKLYVGSCGWCS